MPDPSSSDAPEVLVATSDNLPGHEIRKVIGHVMGITVRTQNPFSEGVKALDGGVNPRRVKAVGQWREDAIKQLISAAKEKGGNAVIAMRFDHRMVTEHWAEICAYGTAVVVEPPPGGGKPDEGEKSEDGKPPEEPKEEDIPLPEPLRLRPP